MDEEGGIKPEVVNRKEVSKRLAGGRVIPRMLAVLGLIAMVGCGNVENPVNPPPVALVQEMLDNSPDATEPITKKAELPADVVSPEELAEKYHTRVWNLPDIKLHLRQKALENESVFQDILAGNVESLDVVLLDGPYLNTRFMSEEQKAGLPELVYELHNYEVIERLKREKYFKEESPRKREFYNHLLEDLNRRLTNREINQQEFDIKKELLNEGMRSFLEGPTEEDLNKTDGIGLYVSTLDLKVKEGKDSNDWKKYDFNDYKTERRVYILLALRENKKEEQSGYLRVVMDGGGPSGGHAPKTSQSFPDPSKYHIVPEHEAYPVGGQSAGFVIRHEFAHHKANHPKTDWVALEGIQKAYEAYKNGDDNLYYFVIETPEGNIYTRTRTPVEQPAI